MSRHATQPMYHPSEYWNAKARQARGDVFKAVGMDDPLENVCIERVQKKLIPRAIRRFVLPHFRPGDAVLDFGCGTGRWIELLTAAGYAYSGIDISPEMIAMAKGVHPEADLRSFDGLHLPFPDENFAIVVSIGVVHHNDYSAQDVIIPELARVAKSGGFLVLFEGIGPHAQQGVVEYPRPPEIWHKSLQSQGLKLVHARRARYWILRSMYLDLAAERLEKIGLKPGRMARMALRVDAVLDPYLLGLLPWWYVTRELMVWRKAV